jgi:hypothetical protein
MSKNVKIYKTLILPVVLYGCETWAMTLREERRLRMFENGAELRDLYSSPSIIRIIKLKMRWAGHVA